MLSHLKDYEPNIVRRAKFHKLVCFVSFSFLFFFSSFLSVSRLKYTFITSHSR